jgi:DNA-binding transcriptional regulator YhcF (GntR family)
MGLNIFHEMEIKQYQVVDRNSPLPLGYQITSNIEKQITTRAIKPGEYIPSVRWLAAVNQLNPSTVARSYKILLKKKVIKADKTRGYKVMGHFKKPRIARINWSG